MNSLRRISFLLIIVTLSRAGVSAIVKNPPLKTFTVGTETEFYRWQHGTPYVDGSYEDDSTYRLTGNGQGVYWCQDGAGYAYVKAPVTKITTVGCM